jgi:hypothetical protein
MIQLIIPFLLVWTILSGGCTYIHINYENVPEAVIGVIVDQLTKQGVHVEIDSFGR